METEEEMIEEHLDEEYQNSEIDEEFADVESQIVELEQKQASITNDIEFQTKLEKAITLLRLHVQNYQRIIIFNRRRAKQRVRKRQCALRNFFLQSLMEMQIRFVEMLPLAVEPKIFLDYVKNPESFEDVMYNREAREEESESEEGGLGFYEDIVSNFSEDQWLDTFHMPKSIFTLICSKLKLKIDDSGMHYESLIAMCIYTLATGSNFRSVGLIFNVDQTFVRSALYKFVECFLNEFSESLIKMPTEKDELDEIAKGFQKASNITPSAVGVLSVFELPTFSYCGRYKPYGMDRVIVQVCIDNRLHFRKVEVAHQKPSMFLRSPNDISNASKQVSANTIPYFLIAPPLYPLRTWLMQKYDKPSESWEYDFNKSLDHLNIFREVSLQRLFGRWQVLTSTEFIEPESKSLIVKTCCALHNLLEDSGDLYSEEWSSNMDLTKYNYNVEPVVMQCFNDSEAAILKRDLIAKLIQLSNCENEEGL